MIRLLAAVSVLFLVLVAPSSSSAGQADPMPAGSGAPGRTDAAPLSLAEARRRALDLSPELRAAQGAAAAAAGRWRQAKAWANPELEVEAEEFGGNRPGWDRAEVTWTLDQRLELFGTRGARTQAAQFGYRAAAHSAEAARLDLLAEVDRRFAGALFAQARVAAFAATDSLAAEAVRAVTALVTAGEESPIELDRTEAERTLVATRLTAARLDRTRALRDLAQLWGSLEPDFASVEGSLAPQQALPGGDPLFTSGGDLPDLERAAAEVGRAEAEIRLSSRERLPQLAVHGGIRHFEETDERSYLGGLTLSLPLFDRRGGAIEEARGRLAQARAEREAIASRIALARATAHDALATALETSRELRDGSLRRAEAVHASVQEGYQRGKFRLLDLIDARRLLLQARLEQLEALHAVWIARADLERLTGHVSPEIRGDSR